MFEPKLKLEHQDSRGEIYSIELPNDRELMLIHSTPGAFRGGHSHDCDEVVTLLSGKMRYHKREIDNFKHTQIIQEGDSGRNPPGVIHMGEFLEDTWLIEMKMKGKGDWSQTDYEPWRKMVRESQ